MTVCIVCGETMPRARIVDPGAPPRVAIVDAGEVARAVQSHAGDGLGLAQDLVELLGRAPRFARCPRCASLTRLGGAAESWVVGPDAPPPDGDRRVTVVPAARRPFDEVWKGARQFVVVELPADILVGDWVRIVESHDDEQRDPSHAPRHVLGHVTSVQVMTQAMDGGGRAIVGFRAVRRGSEDRALESRRARMVAALDSTGAHVASAASVLGLSVREAYRWVHELGLEDRIRKYRTRTRRA